MDAAEQTRLLTLEVRRRREAGLAYRRDHPWRWAARLVAAVVVPVVIFGLFESAATFAADRALSLHRSMLWPLIGYAGFMVAMLVVAVRRGSAVTDEAVALEVRRRQAEWGRVTGRGWKRRATLLGVGMGVAMVAVVIMMGPVLVSLTTGTPLQEWLMGWEWFVVLTFLWTIPLAFAIRWWVRWQHGRFRRQAGLEVP